MRVNASIARHVKPQAKTLRDALKSETAQDHHAIEAGMDLLRSTFTLSDYCHLLQRFYQFHIPFENYLREAGSKNYSSSAFYCKDRYKSQWLSQDLHLLGIQAPAHDGHVPHEQFSQLFPSDAHVWGAIYVIEGSTLGGTLLAKHFGNTLGISQDCGLRFFTGYGAHTKQQWHETLQRLNACEENALSSEDIVVGAKRMFSLFETYLINLIKEQAD